MGSNLVPHRVLFCEQHERPATRPTAKPPPTPTHFTMGGKAKPTKHTSKELAKKVPPPSPSRLKQLLNLSTTRGFGGIAPCGDSRGQWSE